MKIQKLMLVLSFGLMTLGCQAADQKPAPLTFAVLSEVCGQKDSLYQQQCQRSKQSLSVVSKQLSDVLNQPVNYRIYSTVREAKSYYNKHNADFLYMKLGPYFELKSQDKSNCLQAIASSVQEGKTDYASVYITTSAKDMQLSDLHDQRIGLIRGSVSGDIVPMKKLQAANVLNKNHIVVYEDYYQAVEALRKGSVDGIFAADAPFVQGAFGGSQQFHIALVLQSHLPTAVVVVNRCEMPKTTVDRLQQALYQVHVNYTHESGINSFSGFQPIGDLSSIA